jgi:hypothetical protein
VAPMGGGGGNVPIIKGDPPSGEDNALFSSAEDVSALRVELLSVRGGVISGEEVTPPPPGCNASIRRTRELSSNVSYPFRSGNGPQDMGTVDIF